MKWLTIPGIIALISCADYREIFKTERVRIIDMHFVPKRTETHIRYDTQQKRLVTETETTPAGYWVTFECEHGTTVKDMSWYVEQWEGLKSGEEAFVQYIVRTRVDKDTKSELFVGSSHEIPFRGEIVR
jgi:hypothetical protein